jgi:hypothetical protein
LPFFSCITKIVTKQHLYKNTKIVIIERNIARRQAIQPFSLFASFGHLDSVHEVCPLSDNVSALTVETVGHAYPLLCSRAAA